MASSGSAAPVSSSGSRPAGTAGGVLLIEDSTAPSIGSSPAHHQPFVEKDRRRARVERGLAAGLLGERRGEALVVELDRHARDRAQPVSEMTRLARLFGVAAPQ